MTRHLTLRIRRYQPGAAPRYDRFAVEVPETANVLDALERAWADHDRTLAFRHACHHASCGSCGLRINGVEKLPCVTPVSDYPDGATLTLEPLRNFRVICDLVVDASPFYARLQAVGAPVMCAADSLHADGHATLPDGLERFTRFENCLECGLCVSACPAMAADPFYLGPATMAGAERALVQGAPRPALLRLLDDEHGLWRCHSAWECTEVCPSEVRPAEAIMRLRRAAAEEKVRQLMARFTRRGRE